MNPSATLEHNEKACDDGNNDEGDGEEEENN